jgi:large subunit ribosomal protein L17
MRHRNAFRKLNRTTAHRWALRRNLAQSLFEHGQVRTTLAKAKEVRPFVESLITMAKLARQGDLEARRRIEQVLTDRAVIDKDHQSEYEDLTMAKRRKVLRARTGRRYRTGEPKAGMPFTAESIVHRLITQVADKFADRPGGYTRLIRLSKTRIGDSGEQAIVQLVGREEAPGTLTKGRKTARRRRTDRRYAAAAKFARQMETTPARDQVASVADPPDGSAPATDDAS